MKKRNNCIGGYSAVKGRLISWLYFEIILDIFWKILLPGTGVLRVQLCVVPVLDRKSVV